MKGLCGRQEKGTLWVSKNKNTSWHFRNKHIEMITNLGVRMKRLESEGRNWLNDDPIEEMGIGLRFGPPCSSHGLGPHPHQLFRAIASRSSSKTGWWSSKSEVKSPSSVSSPHLLQPAGFAMNLMIWNSQWPHCSLSAIFKTASVSLLLMPMTSLTVTKLQLNVHHPISLYFIWPLALPRELPSPTLWYQPSFWPCQTSSLFRPSRRLPLWRAS